MKKILTRITVLAFCVIMLAVSGIGIYADAYSTYTYSINGFAVSSPDAYTADRQIDSTYMGLSNPITDPRDLYVDKDENVYIVDGASNRVIVLDKYYKFRFEFGQSFVNDQGVPDGLLGPSGVYAIGGYIYVADTDNFRIVLFDMSGNYVKTIREPKSDVFPDGSVYKPISLVVDDIGNMYVVSSTTYMGIIVLDSDGNFKSFIGATKVTYNVAEILWRSFLTAEQRAQGVQYVSSEYNNITIDDEGFIYVTTSAIDETNQQASTDGNSAAYSPVKKLNSAGNDIMKRSGFFGPGGEPNVITSASDENVPTGASRIVDVAVGPEGTWSIIDEKRSKIYTYDDYGRLLYIFGDKGSLLGNVVSARAISYQGTKILLLDKTSLNITVFERTQYGDILINALKNNNERNYGSAIEDWEAILQRNGNFDTAYVGIGKAKYREGKWEEAMEYFKYAYDTGNYSDAFKMYRQEWVSKYVIVIPIVVVAVCFLLGKFFGYAGKVNKKATLRAGKKTYKEQVLYAFHLMTHPFDGFWDLKHEKRGSALGATFWVVLAIIAFTYQGVGQAYLFNPTGAVTSIITQVLSIVVPLFLWVTANWCLTTLFDGEGSYKDIYTATGYSLAPLPIFVIPATILTHIFTLNEVGIVSLLVSIGWVLVGFLVFFGMMVTHGYSLFANIATCLGTILGAVFIMFIALLFTGLLSKMVGFVSSIVNELSYRM